MEGADLVSSAATSPLHSINDSEPLSALKGNTGNL
jgi:hypothetical protein